MQPVTIASLMDIATLSGPVLSPDGKHAAYVVERQNYKKNRYDACIHLLDCGTGASRQMTFSGKERLEIENILSAMLEEYEYAPPLSDKVMENYMNILITKMFRKSQPGMSGQAAKDIWQELSEYIEQNPDAELTLSALASKCFYNPSYFSRMFKQKFHMPLTEYVTRKRIEYAIRLLEESELSVDEISQRTGFVDRSTFYAAFSRITGTTPAQYRIANRA